MNDADRLAEIREEYVGWGDQWDLMFLLRLLDEARAEIERLREALEMWEKLIPASMSWNSITLRQPEFGSTVKPFCDCQRCLLLEARRLTAEALKGEKP